MREIKKGDRALVIDWLQYADFEDEYRAELALTYIAYLGKKYDRLEKAALKLRDEMKRHALFLKPSDLYMCMEMEVSITEFDEAIKQDGDM